MSARLLNMFADENPELQKQIGCMTGIFHMFDRHHLLRGRRFSVHGNKKFTPGHVLSNNNGSEGERNTCYPQIVLEKNISKNLSELSPRASLASSSGSSFCSLECNASIQQEVPAFSRAITPERCSMNSPSLKSSDSTARPNCQQPEFKDLMKDSIYRETRGLSVKTATKEEGHKHILNHRGSPRAMRMPKAMNGTFVSGTNGRSSMTEDLNESLKVLMQRKEAPRSFYEAKDASFYRREARRFSYDGREISRASLDSRENIKGSTKLRELPRLSLDSREGSMRSSCLESRADLLLKDKDRSNADHDASTSVVAKLMGLEAMPNFSSTSQEPISLMPTNSKKDFDNMFSKSPRLVQDGLQDQLSRTPKSSFKDSVVPKLCDNDSDMKIRYNPKIPIETAPWKQQEKVHVSRKVAVCYREAHVKQQRQLAYSKLERRLKELELKHPDKDLKALKQILDAVQAKGLSATKKTEDKCLKASGQKNLCNENDVTKSHPVPVFSKMVKTQKASGSPIVIMKPAKSVNKLGVNASRSIPFESLPSLLRIRTSDAIDRKKASVKNRMTENRILEESSNELIRSTDEKSKENSSQKAMLQMAQASSRPQKSPRENGGSIVKSTSSLSPRLQQRKVGLEKKLSHRVSPSQLDKPRTPLTNKQSLDSVSPRGKLRPKPAHVQRNASQGDDTNHNSYSDMSSAPQLNVEVTREQSSQSPSGRAAIGAASRLEQKKSSSSSKQDVPTRDIDSGVPEQQPSPISVLDASFYGNDLLPSPVNKRSNALEDVDTQVSDDCWMPICPSNTLPSNLSSQFNHKKLEHIDKLVQNHRRLSSANNEIHIMEKIASLCETLNPDHEYISEILVASGLVRKDLTVGSMNLMALQLHPSGHPINPDLFLVLEQMKLSSLSKPDTKKLHRKLVFDLVNEILVDKLELTSPLPCFRAKSPNESLQNGWPLLKDLCYGIELLQRQRLNGDCFNDENLIAGIDVIHGSEWWEDYGNEVPEIVLEIERLIFKEFVNEIVSGEAESCLQIKPSRRRRQLFKKTS